jgi:hypothetical protein
MRVGARRVVLGTSGGKDGVEAPCPYCGREGWFANDGPCEHLVADWAPDPYDNEGGVLGEGMTDNAAFLPASNLARACCDLLVLVHEDETKVEERRAALDRAVAVDGSAWWQDVLEIIDNNDYIEIRPEELARFANPIVESLLLDVPGIEVTSVLLGGSSIMAGFGNFVWSRDRDAAVDAIARAIDTATASIRSVTAGIR